MTIFIEDFIRAGYCKWLNGKIVVSPDCPGGARKELAGIDRMWLGRILAPDPS